MTALEADCSNVQHDADLSASVTAGPSGDLGIQQHGTEHLANKGRAIDPRMQDKLEAAPDLDADTLKYRAMWEAWAEKRRHWASVLEQIKSSLA